MITHDIFGAQVITDDLGLKPLERYQEYCKKAQEEMEKVILIGRVRELEHENIRLKLELERVKKTK